MLSLNVDVVTYTYLGYCTYNVLALDRNKPSSISPWAPPASSLDVVGNHDPIQSLWSTCTCMEWAVSRQQV